MIDIKTLKTALDNLRTTTSMLEFLSQVECCEDHYNEHILHISDILKSSEYDLATAWNALACIKNVVLDANVLNEYYRSALDCWIKVVFIAEGHSILSRDEFCSMILKGMDLFNEYLTWAPFFNDGLDRSLLALRLDLIILWLETSGNSLSEKQERYQPTKLIGFSKQYTPIRKSYVESILLELGQSEYMTRLQALKLVTLADQVSERISKNLDSRDKATFVCVDMLTGEARWQIGSQSEFSMLSDIAISDSEILSALFYSISNKLMMEGYEKIEIDDSRDTHMIPLRWFGVDKGTSDKLDSDFIVIEPIFSTATKK